MLMVLTAEIVDPVIVENLQLIAVMVEAIKVESTIAVVVEMVDPFRVEKV